MIVRTWRSALLALVAAVAASLAGPAGAEPPSRVARVGYVAGTVSLAPAGQPDWVRAAVNRPLTTGDQLWSDRDGRAEVQLGGAALRLGAATSVTVLNLDDRTTQLQLAQGTLLVRVRRLAAGDVFEVNTPNLALTLRRAGDYRIEVDPDENATEVVVRSGEGEVYGDGVSYVVRARQGYRFWGTDLSEVESLAAATDDDLDRWARARDRSSTGSVSARYVSPDLVGYEDLDDNGRWRTDPTYGPVWTPARVATGWTPYHDGRWAWVDPWGWTWIDDAPWGYAVSHYGRWARIGSAWSWVPGPRRERAVYAPAMVAFVGGRDVQVSLSIGGGGGGGGGGGVGWFPLAPREVYRPAYPVSRRYFENINRSNAVIAPPILVNSYNTTIVNHTTNNVQVVYVNQQVAGAVVAVPAAVFAQSQPVARAALRLSRESAHAAPVAQAAAVVPMPQSVHGGAPDATARPPDRRRPVIARTAPPPPPIAFAAQQAQLAARPGRPIDDAQRVQLKPSAPAAPAPAVTVVPATRAPAPTAAPPLTPPAAGSARARRADADRRDRPEAAATRPGLERSPAVLPGAPTAPAAQGPKTPPAPQVQPVPPSPAAPPGPPALPIPPAPPAQAEAPKPGAPAPRAERNDRSKADEATVDRNRREALKAEAAQVDAAKVEASKAADTQARAARNDASKAAAARAEAARDRAQPPAPPPRAAPEPAAPPRARGRQPEPDPKGGEERAKEERAKEDRAKDERKADDRKKDDPPPGRRRE